MITHTCDRCGKTAEQKKGEMVRAPDKWVSISPRTYARANDAYFEVCPECAEKLNLPDGESHERRKAIEVRMLEILEEIARTQVEECERCGE